MHSVCTEIVLISLIIGFPGQVQWTLSHLLNLVFFDFLGPHPRHMEVLRLGVKLELQLPDYTTAGAMRDSSRVCDLHHSSQQRRILSPLREARDQTCVLMDTNQIHFHWTTMGTPKVLFFWKWNCQPELCREDRMEMKSSIEMTTETIL